MDSENSNNMILDDLPLSVIASASNQFNSTTTSTSNLNQQNQSSINNSALSMNTNKDINNNSTNTTGPKIKIKMTAAGLHSTQPVKELNFDDCRTVIDVLLKHDETWIFREPVDGEMVFFNMLSSFYLYYFIYYFMLFVFYLLYPLLDFSFIY
jgi:hypothetical protein